MGLPQDGARRGSGPRFRQRALTKPFAALRRARTRWRSLSGNARLTVCVVAAGILVLLWTALPFFWVVWVSFMTKAEVVEGIVQTIDAPTLDNYMRIIGIAETDALFGGQTRLIGRGFLNSFIVALPTALLATAIATLAGYAFGRFEFPGKLGLLFGLLVTRVLPPIAILIPYYTVFQSVGMIGNHGSLMLTYLTSITPLLAWILMGYFATLPRDVERAARIDGCGRLAVLWNVMIPMALPGISAAFIIAFLFCWNELLFAIILTGGSTAQTLSPALQTTAQNIVLFAAACTLSIMPPMLLALFFQRFITRLNIVDPMTARGA